MQELINYIEEAWTSKMPFVAYHFPEANEVRCFFPKDSEVRYLQSYDEAGFVFSAFKENSKPVLFPEANSKALKFELIDLKMLSQSKFRIKENPEEKENYLKLLAKTIHKIKTGELRKIVLSRKISAEYELDRPSDLLLKLIRLYPEALTYVWFHPDIGLWAGASPELLAKTYRTQFKTMALAGTKRVDEDREWTDKELDEQQMVTDEIVNALKSHTEHLKVSERKTEKAGELLHLRTDISATLEALKLGNVLQELHPTPAVCGLPKDKAYQFLKENEGYDRKFYSGFFGELNMPQHHQRSSRTRNQENQAYKSVVRASNLYVNLRCMNYEEGKINIYVGGGITKDSIPEDEWTETVNKSRTMLNVL